MWDWRIASSAPGFTLRYFFIARSCFDLAYVLSWSLLGTLKLNRNTAKSKNKDPVLRKFFVFAIVIWQIDWTWGAGLVVKK